MKRVRKYVSGSWIFIYLISIFYFLNSFLASNYQLLFSYPCIIAFMPIQFFSTFTLAFLLGLRHGVDWDHIAAITDIVGSEDDRKKSFILSFFYIIGHASVVILFGLLAVLVGVRLPDWIDTIMEPFVGITLILLGVYLLVTLIRNGKNFRLKSRWIVLLKLVHKIVHLVKETVGHHHKHKEIDYPEKYRHHTAFTIGVIHGIGAETPTQVLLFVTAAGVGGSLAGSIVVLAFVSGLVISNTFISLFSLTGYAKAKKNSNVYLLLGAAAGIFSLIVGLLFLLGSGSILPAILGG